MTILFATAALRLFPGMREALPLLNGMARWAGDEQSAVDTARMTSNVGQKIFFCFLDIGVLPVADHPTSHQSLVPKMTISYRLSPHAKSAQTIKVN